MIENTKELGRIVGIALFYILIVGTIITVLVVGAIAISDNIKKYNSAIVPYEQRVINQYQEFERNCMSTEQYTKDQCLLIWAGRK